ncbi:hypothetical protein Nmel_018517 [Mimus melanotis]
MWGMTPAEERNPVKSLAEFPRNYKKILTSPFLNVKWIPPSVNPGKQQACAFPPTAKILSGFPPFPFLLKFPLKARNTGTTPTSTSDGGFDQGVQLLITTDRQLQVPGCNPFDFEILGCVPSQLQHLQDSGKRWECRGQGCCGWGGGSYLSGQVLEDGCAVDSCRGSHTPVAGGPSLQVPVDAADWELRGD